jgi:hypothetical protein
VADSSIFRSSLRVLIAKGNEIKISQTVITHNTLAVIRFSGPARRTREWRRAWRKLGVMSYRRWRDSAILLVQILTKLTHDGDYNVTSISRDQELVSCEGCHFTCGSELPVMGTNVLATNRYQWRFLGRFYSKTAARIFI